MVDWQVVETAATKCGTPVFRPELALGSGSKITGRSAVGIDQGGS
jgi:hypothetical protein